MKLSKEDRRKCLDNIEEAQQLIDQLEGDWYVGEKQMQRLEEVYMLLTRVGARLEGKHGKRRSK